MKWPTWSNAVFGLWLIMALWVLHYHAAAPVAEDVVLGTAVVFMALWWANAEFTVTAPAWGSLALGAWIMVAPWLLGYRSVSSAVRNDLLIGLLIAAFSFSGAASRPLMADRSRTRTV